jgi:hypothetical protein
MQDGASMYKPMKRIVTAAMVAIACGCAGQPGSKSTAAVPAALAAVPAHCTAPVLQPLDLDKADYRFRMIGGPYKVTSSEPLHVEVVYNKHGLDPDQIDIQPTRLGAHVGRAVITVTDEATGCAFDFHVLVQK